MAEAAALPDQPLGGDELGAAALALARRFAAGATMWCVAPAWPAHGRHVAVEFVHPVVVGKRALPAISVDARGAIASLRLLAQPGDVLLAVATGEDGLCRSLMMRAAAWGLYRIWVGAGPRPGPGLAEQVVWSEQDDPDVAARNGELTLLYHLLWELTHVVFEHPGLLEEPASNGDATVCVTCADEGRVGEVQALRAGGGAAEVLASGRRETIDVSLLGPVAPGDLVLVHAGVALSVVEQQGGRGR